MERGLEALLAEYVELRDRQAALRAQPVDDQGKARGEVAGELQRSVARAASALPARGVEVERVQQWLAGADGELPREFAVAVLFHRKEFPAVYLDGFVAEAVRCGGTGGGRMLALASEWLGGAAVLDVMTELCEAGKLSHADGKFFLYYVRSRDDESPDRLSAARRTLTVALRRADDAPPGARDA